MASAILSRRFACLYFDIKIDLFAAMKRIAFQKHGERVLKARLLHRARDQGIQVEVGTDIWIEPNHPEWFGDCTLNRRAMAILLD